MTFDLSADRNRMYLQRPSAQYKMNRFKRKKKRRRRKKETKNVDIKEEFKNEYYITEGIQSLCSHFAFRIFLSPPSPAAFFFFTPLNLSFSRASPRRHICRLRSHEAAALPTSAAAANDCRVTLIFTPFSSSDLYPSECICENQRREWDRFTILMVSHVHVLFDL